jgi:hypothetical protein
MTQTTWPTGHIVKPTGTLDGTCGGTYLCPARSRALLQAERRAEFEGMYDRCARVEALNSEAWARTLERIVPVDALKAAIREIVESDIAVNSPTEEGKVE